MVSGRPIPTRCVQTGQLYPSLGAALRENGISEGLWRKAYLGYPTGPAGLLFDPIEPDDPDWQRVPAHRKSNRRGKPVRCVETGAVYQSIAEAARAIYVDRNCIYYSIYKRGRAAGLHWEWAHG